MGKIKNFFLKIKKKHDLRIKDALWYGTDQCSWSLLPPSFYETHTEEEIIQALKEEYEKCRKLLDEFQG